MKAMNTSKTTTHDRNTVLPPADLEEMLDLSRFLDRLTEPAALLGPDGQTVPLPMETFVVLRRVVEAMQVGKAITLAPVDQMLTTQEAANFLGISRPTLVKLLEAEVIRHEKTPGGRHRRLRLQDVVTYQENMRQKRSQTLDTLTAEAMEDGLYDRSATEYAAALREARMQLSGSDSGEV